VCFLLCRNVLNIVSISFMLERVLNFPESFNGRQRIARQYATTGYGYCMHSISTCIRIAANSSHRIDCFHMRHILLYTSIWNASNYEKYRRAWSGNKRLRIVPFGVATINTRPKEIIHNNRATHKCQGSI
jgi:hypothetical protein